jgi:predicted ATPase
MLTSITVRRFKKLNDATIELANPVIFIGPNNSGKTSALQALALWSLAVRKWSERREQGNATRRTGVTINRREIINIPLLNSYALWSDLRVRKGNQPIRIEIEVKGVLDDAEWVCGMAFESADQENIRCRPLNQADENGTPYRVPDGAKRERIAFLPPMSGLIAQEDLLQTGSIERRIGEGRTADVLRNLCYRLYSDFPSEWDHLIQSIDQLFGVQLQEPIYNSENGVLSLEYIEASGTQFDLNASGQGFRQTLLLLAYLYQNQNTALLLDEPDAHLEILRQRQIYQALTDAARRLGNQIIIATHSEVILTDAAQRDLVIAFVGRPHRISKAAQVRRALADYGFEHYAQAEQTGFVLYLEGSTDLAILRELAQRLKHPAAARLERPFIHYVANQPSKVGEHFFAIREAFPGMVGAALFDRLDTPPKSSEGLKMLMWERREIENYIAFPEVLVAFTQEGTQDDLFGLQERTKREALMQRLIEQYIPPIALNDRSNSWWKKTKMSDDFLDGLIAAYFQALNLPNILRKSDYHVLARYIEVGSIDPEVKAKLDSIEDSARSGEQARHQWIEPEIAETPDD